MNLIQVKVLEIQDNDQFAGNLNLGKVLFLPRDRLVEKTSFDKVN